ncbi:MAG: septum formation initiator family protein [Bacillota bacterium]
MNNRKNLTILCVTMIFLLVVIMIFQFVTLAVATQKQETLIAEIAEMEKAIDDISDEIDYRETLLYIEKYARENLELYGDNDIIFVPNE